MFYLNQHCFTNRNSLTRLPPKASQLTLSSAPQAVPGTAPARANKVIGLSATAVSGSRQPPLFLPPSLFLCVSFRPGNGSALPSSIYREHVRVEIGLRITCLFSSLGLAVIHRTPRITLLQLRSHNPRRLDKRLLFVPLGHCTPKSH